MAQCESILKMHAINWGDGRKWMEVQCLDEKGHKGSHSYDLGSNHNPFKQLVNESSSLLWKDGARCECSECR